MIYNQLNLSDSIGSLSQPHINPAPVVEVVYNGIPIHSITGPVPVVDISHSFNINDNNVPESLITTINLNGLIFRSAQSPGVVPRGTHSLNNPAGFSGIIKAVKDLQQLLNSCPIGTLEFKCNNISLHTVSGLVVKDLSFDNTDDNWAQTASYSISLEAEVSLYSGNNNVEKYVKDRQDSWSIEPIEDATYVDYTSDPRTLKYEYSNPKLGRAQAGRTFNNTTENINLSIKNVPQFRITRRLSARGMVPPSGSGCLNAYEPQKENSKAYVFAKAWVESMSSNTFRKVPGNDHSIPYINGPFDQNLIAFNHKRNVNIDVVNGTYEANDSWLAMPSGIPYTETYTIESSTNEEYIRTVRVAGNIVGLVVSNPGLAGPTGVLPSGTGSGGVIDAKLTLSEYSRSGITNGSTPYRALDKATQQPNNLPSNNWSGNQYKNALDAWLNHIKPSLYRRASLAVNTPDRTLQYVPPHTTRPPTPPNNPIYCGETLLSIIPVGTSESHDPRKGTINYSYEYNNRLSVLSGVISENINITYDNPNDAMSEVNVIGRALGPILQRTTRSTPKKTISVEIAIPPVTGVEQISLNSPKCPLHRSQYLFQDIEKIIEANRPYSPSTFLGNDEKGRVDGLVYTSSDNEQWNPKSGKYSRTVSWIYQQSNLTHDFRDH